VRFIVVVDFGGLDQRIKLDMVSLYERIALAILYSLVFLVLRCRIVLGVFVFSSDDFGLAAF